MADRQFTYQVDVNTASAKTAADTVRAMFTDVITSAVQQMNSQMTSAIRQMNSQIAAGARRAGGGALGGQEGIRGGGGGRVGGGGGGLAEIKKFTAESAKAANAEVADRLRVMQAAITYRRGEVREANKAAAQVAREATKAANAEISERQRVLQAAITYRRMEVREANKAAAQAYNAMRNEANEMNKKFDANRRGGGGGGGSLQGILKTGFLAYGAGLAVQQAVDSTVEFGRVGAQQLRMVDTFKQLGDQIGVNAEEMAQAVKEATNSSISDMQAMQFGANILAQRFAGEIDDIAGDTAILATASRRLAQVYTDEEGKLLSTEAVFSRLVKFAREGNKELVDQFGLSNELIAQTLGIPNEGLRGAEGAAQRWKGMVTVLSQELERLGQPVDSTADRMEQAFAKMTTAMDKFRAAAAEPITVAVEGTAGLIDYFAELPANYKVVTSTRPAMERIQKMGADGTDNVAILNAVRSFEELDTAWVRGEMSANEYWEAIEKVIEQFHRLNDILYGVQPAMDKMNLVVSALTGGSLTRDNFPGSPGASASAFNSQAAERARTQAVLAGQLAPDDLTEAERDYRMAVGNSAERIRILQAAVDAAAVGTDEYWAAMAALSGATLSFADEMNAIKGEIHNQVGAIKQWQIDMQMVGASPAEKLAIMQGAGADIKPGSSEDRAYQLELANLQQAVIEENARLGESAQREWMQTAKEVERMFETAADKIMSIPGVTSLTPVTEAEMLESKYGAYREQPDEWMRRVRDELLNKVDYANVSREQVEGLTGLPGGLPPELLISRLEEKWQSGALFADPANLDLMNMDAIRGRFEEMKAGETGRANQKNFIMEQLGISAQDAALITGTQAPIVQMMTGGQSEEEIGSQIGGTLKNVMNLASGDVKFAKPLLSQWSAEFGHEDIIAGLKSLGKTAALNFFAGFNESIGSSGFANAIILAIKTDITKSLADMAAAS